MVPPNDVCRQLYRINKKLRVGWYGRKQRYPEELNPGEFALVQLFHVRDVGPISDPYIFDELWDTGFAQDPETKQWDIRRIDRGPIFSREGLPRRDWDPLYYVPVVMFVANGQYESFGRKLTNESFFDGHFIASVLDWREKPRNQRARDSRIQAGKDLAREVDAMTSDMADELHRASLKADATRVPVAKKHFKDDPYFERLEEGRKINLEDFYKLPGD